MAALITAEQQPTDAEPGAKVMITKTNNQIAELVDETASLNAAAVSDTIRRARVMTPRGPQHQAQA